MWINTPKHELVAQSRQQRTHPFAEEARARSEVFGLGLYDVHGSVCVVEHFFYRLDLLDERGIAQRPRGLVTHRVVAQLVSVAEELLQYPFVPVDLRADDEEGRGRIVGFEDLHDFGGVLGWAVIDCEGDDL